MKITSAVISLAALFSVAWNSPLCGSCSELTHGGNSIYVTAIDTVGDGFDISLEAVNTHGSLTSSMLRPPKLARVIAGCKPSIFRGIVCDGSTPLQVSSEFFFFEDSCLS